MKKETESRPGLQVLQLTLRSFAKAKLSQRQLKLWGVWGGTAGRTWLQDAIQMSVRAMHTHSRGRQNLWSVLWRVKPQGGFILTHWPTLAKGGMPVYIIDTVFPWDPGPCYTRTCCICWMLFQMLLWFLLWQENQSLCRDCHCMFTTAVKYQNVLYVSLLHWLGYTMVPILFTHIKEWSNHSHRSKFST